MGLRDIMAKPPASAAEKAKAAGLLKVPGSAPAQRTTESYDDDSTPSAISDHNRTSQLRGQPAVVDDVYVVPMVDARFADFQRRMYAAVFSSLDTARDSTGTEVRRREVRTAFETSYDDLAATERIAPSPRERELMLTALIDDICGFGPLEPALQDQTVTEIMVNQPSQVYVEQSGKLRLSNIVFRNDEHIRQIIDRIVSPIGRRIDDSSPMVDARLPDGSRVNAIIAPLALDGSVLTIRKFSPDAYTVKALTDFGTASPVMFDFLRACVQARLNIFISGGTGSGKTTTLNVLSSFVPDDERIVTIEDSSELQLKQAHVVRLESRPANIEGHGVVQIRDLVRNALRMRPDRIIVGECRAGEALDMLQAMNTGHDGSMSTGHANSPRDMLSRLETMVLMAGVDLPVRAIREQVAAAVDVIVQQSRMRDGSRRIINITEVQGMEGDVITLQDVFVYNQTGFADGKVKGYHGATGVRPKFADRIETAGIVMPWDIFLPPEPGKDVEVHK